MTVQFYSRDHEGTIDTHETETEAEEAARPELDNCADAWPEGTDRRSCGVLIETRYCCERNRREDPSGNFDYLCEYELAASDPIAQISEAFPDIARKLDALAKFEALFAEYSEHMNRVPWEPIGLGDIEDLIERAKR